MSDLLSIAAALVVGYLILTSKGRRELLLLLAITLLGLSVSLSR